jgi:hypothetical protein
MKKIYIYNKCPEMESSIFYPEPAAKVTPEWWKKIPFYNNFDFRSRLGYGVDETFLNNFKESKKQLQTTTIKGCPAVFDAVSSGYILRAWCDIVISVNENYEITVQESPPINENNPEKGKATYFDVLEMFSDTSIIKAKNIPKLQSPLYIEGELGVSLLMTHPMYHFNENWTTIPGIVCIDKYPINIKWMFNWTGKPGNYIIEYGTPIIQLIPIVREKIKMLKTDKKIETPINRCPVLQLQNFIKSTWQYLYKNFK